MPRKWIKSSLDRTIDQERNVDPIRQRLKSALYRDFGKFYIGLYNKLTAGQFEFIKKSFIEYLNDMWDGGYISTLDSKKGITPQHKSKYISRIDARRLLEADDDQIYQLIGMGKVKTMVQSKGKKRLIFIDLADVSRLKRRLTKGDLKRGAKSEKPVSKKGVMDAS